MLFDIIIFLVFFIKRGKVAAVLMQYDNFEFLTILERYYFGELDLLFNDNVRKYSHRALEEVELYVLSKVHFRRLYFTEFRNMGLEFVD